MCGSLKTARKKHMSDMFCPPCYPQDCVSRDGNCVMAASLSSLETQGQLVGTGRSKKETGQNQRDESLQERASEPGLAIARLLL